MPVRTSKSHVTAKVRQSEGKKRCCSTAALRWYLSMITSMLVGMYLEGLLMLSKEGGNLTQMFQTPNMATEQVILGYSPHPWVSRLTTQRNQVYRKLSTYMNYCRDFSEGSSNISKSRQCGFHDVRPANSSFPLLDYPIIWDFWWNPRYRNEDPSEMVSIVTQVSIGRLNTMSLGMCVSWLGPISLAVYIPIKNGSHWKDDWIMHLDRFIERQCSQIERVSVLFGNHGDWYPINHLRNLALQQTRAEYVFLLDADFVPNSGMYHTLRTPRYRRYLKDTFSDGNRTVLVVPAFETPSRKLLRRLSRRDVRIPQFRELFRWRYQFNYHQDSETMTLIDPDYPGFNFYLNQFHVGPCPGCHNTAGYGTWLRYGMDEQSLDQIDYSVHNHRNLTFEPYVIASKSRLHRYDVRFRGYGKNKISHIQYILRCQQYSVRVLYQFSVTTLVHNRQGDSQKWIKRWNHVMSITGNERRYIYDDMRLYNERLENHIDELELCEDTTGYTLTPSDGLYLTDHRSKPLKYRTVTMPVKNE